SALRFGDPRVMALLQAITGFTHLPRGFRNRDLRPHVEGLLGRHYSAPQMTYDLRRLRLKGLIHRIPKTHRYTATTYGLKVAFFYCKLYSASFDRNGTHCCPTMISSRDPCAWLSINSIPQSRNCTRRLPLPPEKLASTVTISLFRDV